MRDLKEYTKNTVVPEKRGLWLEDLMQLHQVNVDDGEMAAYTLAYAAGYESGRRSCGKRSRARTVRTTE